MLLYSWTMDAAAAVVEAFNVVGCKKWLMLIVAENRELSNRCPVLTAEPVTRRRPLLVC